MMKTPKILFMSGLLALSMNTYAQEYIINQPATISGKMATIKSLHPNPEFYGNKQVAIRPHHVLHVDMNDGRVIQTQLIQLTTSNERIYKQLFALEHKNVQLKCDSLFEGHTAHHTTKVLCSVEKIQ